MSVDMTRSLAFTFCTTDGWTAVAEKKHGSGANSFSDGQETEYRFQIGLGTWGDNNVRGDNKVDNKVDNNAKGDNNVDNKVDIKVDNNVWGDTVNRSRIDQETTDDTVKHPQTRTRTTNPYNTRTSPVQQQDFNSRSRFYRNPIIAAFFKEIGRADELGSGTRNLYHYTRLYSGTDPIIDEEDAFSVTVPLNDDYSPEVGEGTRGNDITQVSIGDDTVNGTVNDTVNGTVNKIAELNKAGPTLADKIIEAITANSRITYDGLSAAVGMSRRTISREVKALLQQGKICRIGSDKTGHWEVVKK